jgi:nicotinate-nucleotide pyrophosphorylase (carboxylating)
MLTTTQQLIASALKEDIGLGDITTQACIKEGTMARAVIACKQDLVVSGLNVALQVFESIDNLHTWKAKRSDGDSCKEGDILIEMLGDAGLLLSAERTALNFLQRLSGVATLTREFVRAVKGTGVKIVDTRKTTPGYRLLEKKAVVDGRGVNHRMGLYDQYLIKDNHIDVAGGIKKAIEKVKKHREDEIPIEVEVRDENELKEALIAGVNIVMLDNWPIDKLDDAIKLIDEKCKIEISGGITLENIKDYARRGIDYISVGALTHSAKAVDISMKIKTD